MHATCRNAASDTEEEKSIVTELPETITTTQLARTLHRSPAWVRSALIDTGKVQAFKPTSRGQWLILLDSAAKLFPSVGQRPKRTRAQDVRDDIRALRRAGLLRPEEAVDLESAHSA